MTLAGIAIFLIILGIGTGKDGIFEAGMRTLVFTILGAITLAIIGAAFVLNPIVGILAVWLAIRFWRKLGED